MDMTLITPVTDPAGGRRVGSRSARPTRPATAGAVITATIAAMIAVIGASGLRPALAGEAVCVVCEGPDATYSCSPAPSGLAAGVGGAALKYRCVREVAETYGHRQCKTNETPLATCAGTVHMLGTPAAGPAGSGGIGIGGAAPAPEAAGGGDAASQAPGAAASGGGKSDGAGEPKTVVEMAKRTADETKEQIEKSSETVGKAAGLAWRCVTSLFSACGDEAAGKDQTPGAPDQ